MNLPQHIGGYQHLEPEVIAQADDILVSHGQPVDFCHEWAGETVESVETGELCNVYRLIPVTKQGDNDETGWKAVQAEAKAQTAVQAKAGLPTDAKARKNIPIATGFIDYFPLAIAAVAEVSKAGNDQHNPGQPLHWDRSKSGDEADALMRHFVERGKLDKDGLRHSAKLCWRACALLEKELEAEK